METAYTIHKKCTKMLNELSCKLFKHEGLYCCILRMGYGGNLNGYIAVPEEHPLYGKSYSDTVTVANIEEVPFNGNYLGLLVNASDTDRADNEISIDMALNVHGGITYSKGSLACIDGDLLGKLWWYGFDTAHCDDIRPYQTDIDRQYDTGGEYRDYSYVEQQCKQLAEQLSNWK